MITIVIIVAMALIVFANISVFDWFIIFICSSFDEKLHHFKINIYFEMYLLRYMDEENYTYVDIPAIEYERIQIEKKKMKRRALALIIISIVTFISFKIYYDSLPYSLSFLPCACLVICICFTLSIYGIALYISSKNYTYQC